MKNEQNRKNDNFIFVWALVLTHFKLNLLHRSIIFLKSLDNDEFCSSDKFTFPIIRRFMSTKKFKFKFHYRFEHVLACIMLKMKCCTVSISPQIQFVKF